MSNTEGIVSGGADKANAAVTENKQLNAAGSALSPGFNTPFFGCFGNIVGCFLSCCCCCLPEAATRTALDGRDIHAMDILCCPNAYVTRQGIRAKYGIDPAPVPDCIASCLCGSCVVYQNATELGNRSGKDSVFYKLP